MYQTVLLKFSSTGEHFTINVTLVTILPHMSKFLLANGAMVKSLSMVYDTVSLQGVSSTECFIANIMIMTLCPFRYSALLNI